jgi:hypothetical protein
VLERKAMNRIAATTASLALLILIGCASIVDGTTQLVSFNSEPSGAQVLVSGSMVGVTPMSIEIKREKGTTVTIRKDGYEPHVVTLNTKLNPMFWGNIITGGTFGSTTDSMSGASVEYSPDQYFVTLNPIAVPETSRVAHGLERKVRDFILVNFQNLQDDLEDGQGEYLSSLLSLLSVEEGGSEDAIAKLRSLLETNDGDVPGFADAVITEMVDAESEKTSTDRLVELKGLLDDGIISQEEYDRKRQEILEGI